MEVNHLVREILKGRSLENKTLDVKKIEFDEFKEIDIIQPARSSRIKFSNEQKKFPKNLSSNESRAFALHSFANHELLAIEIMAYVLGKFPHHTNELKNFKKSVFSSLKDEQKHLKLYIKRINELGYEFGDFPLTDFFWKYAVKIKKLENYFSMMSLTFEAANLDFAHYYQQVFSGLDDFKSSEIMKIVFEDEISHVKTGVHFLNLWKGNKSLWNYYKETLIDPLSPARSKGIHFNPDFRKLSGFDENYIYELSRFNDGFKITQRRKP